MEIGNRVVNKIEFEINIREMHLALVFAVIINFLFFVGSNKLFEKNDYSDMVAKKEEKVSITLDRYRHKMTVKSFNRSTRPKKQKKTKQASLDALMKMAKSSKKKKLIMAKKQKIANSLAGIVGGIDKANGTKSDLKLNKELISQINQEYSKQSEMNNKMLNHLKKLLANQDPYFKMCYEKSLLSNPELRGLVTVRMQLNGASVVSSVNVKGKQVSNTNSFEGCLLQQAKKIRFPKGLAGEIVKFNLFLET